MIVNVNFQMQWRH